VIELYYWPTPNGHKPTILLEEIGCDYKIVPVDISAGDQFKPDFLKISPNNKIPAILDLAPADGGDPISVFESGAILVYLAEKAGRFLPRDVRGRNSVLEWVFWQVGGLGPMAGQAHHFLHYASDRLPYPTERYVNESGRLYAVLDKRLAGREYICGDYSIADIASYPWVVRHERHAQDLAAFPNVARWFDAISSRPAVKAAYARGAQWASRPVVTEAGRAIVFGQSAATVSRT